MKKIFNILLCLGVLMQNFVFAIPVVAETNDTEEIIEVVALKQGGVKLNPDEDEIYQIIETDELVIDYKVNNVDNFLEDGSAYMIETLNMRTPYTGGQLKKGYVMSDMMTLDSYFAEGDVSVFLYKCNDSMYPCADRELVTSKFITLNIVNYDEINYAESNIYIEDISQGGESIDVIYSPEMWRFDAKINDIEDIDVKIKSINLGENINYKINIFPNEYYTFTGKQLNEGVIVNIPYDELKQKLYDFRSGLTARLSMPLYGDKPLAYKDNGVYDIIFESYTDEELNTFDAVLSYKNYEDIEIKKKDSESDAVKNKYVVNPNYHDKNNELLVDIKGNSYLDKEYDVNITVFDNNYNELYTKVVTLNGNEINDGYSIELDDFVMNLPENIDITVTEYYKVKVNIENHTENIDCFYGYDVSLTSYMFYPNGQKSIGDYYGWSSDYASATSYQLNAGLYDKYNMMNMLYFGKNFESSILYDYEFYYMDERSQGYTKELVRTGKVSGLALNTVGLPLTFNNEEDYEQPAYNLVIKKDGEVIYLDQAVTSIIEGQPTLSFIELTSKNKNVYFQLDNNNYLATKNAKLDAVLTGIGFEDSENYKVSVTASDAYDYGHSNEFFTYEYSFTGYELNNGLAEFPLINENSYDDLRIYIEVMGEDNNLGIFMAFGEIQVSYVDSKKYFSKVDGYDIDDDVLKDIIKKTNAQNFEKNVEIAGNGDIKVYDKNGKEIDGFVGTGMLARIVDEYGRVLFDMDVVVKGDVTGDGDISITDLVKVKQHLAEIEELDEVYEKGADIDGEDEVSITDLVKMSQDVAEIEEIQ